MSGVGDLALWDFSGQDTYFLVHHHFLGCARSIYAVVVNLQDTPAVQFQQASFWLSFLQARVRPSQSIGRLSVSEKLDKIILHSVIFWEKLNVMKMLIFRLLWSNQQPFTSDFDCHTS